ncbi:ABC transporter permease [Candidatus Pacearchaeota archaeon CG10_big_fil_rev_8_21_14_0_10_35_13]|nr:MAG: ABC transporter permease [Candidatus Pacearchaeota archaeon CG10_big_fil_rev_8_21_14_0_10_35_13]
MIKDYFMIGIKNIKKRRLRSWLTMFGIFISIATIFLLISLSLGLQKGVQEEFEGLGGDKFFVQPRGQLGGPGTGGAVTLTEKDAEAIEKVNGIKAVVYYTFGNAKIENSGEVRYVQTTGVLTEDFFLKSDFYKIDEGRMIEAGDTNRIVVGSQYKNNNVFSKNLEVGNKIIINEAEFKIVGILKTTGSPPDDKMIMIPREEFVKLFNTGEKVDQIVAQVYDTKEMDTVAERTKRALAKFRGLKYENRDFTIMTPEEILKSFEAILNILTAFLGGIAAISLIVGGVGITNTMYTSVLERRKEIGTMKAVGAQNKDILMIFTIESGLLGLVGGIIGVGLGKIIGKIIEGIALKQLGTNLLQAAMPVELIIGSLLFSFFVGAISGAVPAIQASKLKPVDALRYE